MLNLQICTVIIMTKKNIKKQINKKIKNKKKKKKKCASRVSNPGHMGSKSTYTSTSPWRPMYIFDKNNQYMLKL